MKSIAVMVAVALVALPFGVRAAPVPKQIYDSADQLRLGDPCEGPEAKGGTVCLPASPAWPEDSKAPGGPAVCPLGGYFCPWWSLDPGRGLMPDSLEAAKWSGQTQLEMTNEDWRPWQVAILGGVLFAVGVGIGWMIGLVATMQPWKAPGT
jgi:hypothetical protein